MKRTGRPLIYLFFLCVFVAILVAFPHPHSQRPAEIDVSPVISNILILLFNTIQEY
jgi:hypothetical protein